MRKLKTAVGRQLQQEQQAERDAVRHTYPCQHPTYGERRRLPTMDEQETRWYWRMRRGGSDVRVAEPNL